MDRRRFLLGAAAAAPLSASSQPAEWPRASLEDERFWHELRWHFSIPHGTAYCNTSTLGASPKAATDAVASHLRWVEEELATCDYRKERPIYLGSYEDEPLLRERLRRLVGGSSKEEIALTPNSTFGMNVIAHGLELGAGDEVVMTDQEHPGGRVGYDVRRARDGVVIREVELPRPCEDPEEIVRRFAAAIGERTKVVTVPHVTSALGVVMPVARIAELAKARGAFMVVDGAQALGHVPVDVKALGCDAYYASAHKWLLAPKGNGLLWLARSAWERIASTFASGEWNNREDAGRRFTHVGTTNQSLVKGFEAALDFLDRIGHATVTQRIRALATSLRNGLATIPAVRVLTPSDERLRAGIVTWRLEGHDDRKVAAELMERDHITVRAIVAGLRTSPHVYVTLADIDRLVARVRSMAGA